MKNFQTLVKNYVEKDVEKVRDPLNEKLFNLVET